MIRHRNWTKNSSQVFNQACHVQKSAASLFSFKIKQKQHSESGRNNSSQFQQQQQLSTLEKIQTINQQSTFIPEDKNQLNYSHLLTKAKLKT